MLSKATKLKFWGMVDVAGAKDCWLWKGAKNGGARGGYGVIKVSSTKVMSSHHIAWILAHGAIAESQVIAHTCGNRACCNSQHLVAMDRSEVMTEVHARKAHSRLGGAHKLSTGVAGEIRLAVECGEPRETLAKFYGVSVATIDDVVSERTWKNEKR